MSLINQVLKDLDKRGVSTNVGEATIRVVHGRSQRSAFWLLVTGAAGMLVVAAVAWMVWQARIKREVPIAAAVAARPVEIMPVVQSASAPAPMVLPSIESLSPAAIVTTGAVQTVTIFGRNFSAGASVNLREEGGQMYANRPLLTLAPGQIELKLNFGKATKAWTLEVLNSDGAASGQYLFTVHAAAAEPSFVADTTATIPKKPAIHRNMPLPEKVKADTVPMEGVSKQPTHLTPQQQADNEYRRADQLMRQGRNTEALAGYEAALQLDAGHELARHSMVNLLLEKKRNADAERVLQDGLTINPQQTNLAMLLARLQAEHNELPLALDTMLKSLPYAEKQPEYMAILAALMQRQNRHKEAVEYYRKALQLKPQAGVWLMGMGISLRAQQQNAEAREAFKNALESNTLSGELQTYVSQQLKEL